MFKVNNKDSFGIIHLVRVQNVLEKLTSLTQVCTHLRVRMRAYYTNDYFH